MRNKEGQYVNLIPKPVLLKRLIWRFISVLLFRPFGTSLFKKWRIFILRLFGAELDYTANVYSSVLIESPWNLIMEENSCIGPYVIIENDTTVTVGKNSTISQYCYLCTSSHDFERQSHDLITAPITIDNDAWVAADSFIGKGVTVGEGAVVGARSSVFKDVEPWTVVGGNPAKFIKKREMTD